jgi:hypothetical protein
MTHLRPHPTTFVLPAQRLPQEPQAGVGPMPWTPKTYPPGGPAMTIAPAAPSSSKARLRVRIDAGALVAKTCEEYDVR